MSEMRQAYYACTVVENVIDSNGFCPISIKLFQEGEDNN